MRKARFTAEGVTVALREVEAGTPVEKTCGKFGVGETIFYRWKK